MNSRLALASRKFTQKILTARKNLCKKYSTDLVLSKKKKAQPQRSGHLSIRSGSGFGSQQRASERRHVIEVAEANFLLQFLSDDGIYAHDDIVQVSYVLFRRQHLRHSFEFVPRIASAVHPPWNGRGYAVRPVPPARLLENVARRFHFLARNGAIAEISIEVQRFSVRHYFNQLTVGFAFFVRTVACEPIPPGLDSEDIVAVILEKW